MVENQRPLTTRWVWFDLDDTLVDFTGGSLAALRELYLSRHLDDIYAGRGGMEQWIASYHGHNSALWEQFNRQEITTAMLRVERFVRPLVDAGMSLTEAEAISPDLDVDYLDRLARLTAPLPFAARTLQAIKERGLGIGILSNGFEGVQQKKLQHAGLDTYIDIVLLSDHLLRPDGFTTCKPDPRIYRRAMELAGEPSPGSHLMVGDNPVTDIAGALAVGWKAILLTKGVSSAAVAEQEKCYPKVDSLLEILDKID